MIRKMRAIDTIPNEPRMQRVIYKPQVEAVCSIVKVPFSALVLIDYEPNSLLIELCSFDEWLRSVSTTETTIEGLARLIFDELCSVLGDIPLEVTLHASTAVHAPVTATIRSVKEHCCG